MPASNRRSSARNSASSVRQTAVVVPKREKAATEEIEVEIPDGAEGSGADIRAAAGSGVSGRRNSGRSSRRSAAGSDRAPGVPRKSGRGPATPEEKAKRRKSIRTVLKIIMGIALTVIVVAVLVLVVFKKDPVAEAASTKLAAVQVALGSVDSRASYEAAVALLASVPELPDFAPRKFELNKALTALESKVAKSERDARVTDNRKSLLNQLAKLTDPETDLSKLTEDCVAFTKNPVDPSGSPNPSLVTEFANATSDIQVRLASIETERGRREAAVTTGVSQRVQLEAEGLLKAEKFGEAIGMIEANATKFPKADLSRARTYVTEAAASAWTSVQGYVDNRYKDYAAPGNTQAVRAKALEEAHGRLDGVISGWGIDSYVRMAGDLRAKY